MLRDAARAVAERALTLTRLSPHGRPALVNGAAGRSWFLAAAPSQSWASPSRTERSSRSMSSLIPYALANSSSPASTDGYATPAIPTARADSHASPAGRLRPLDRRGEFPNLHQGACPDATASREPRGHHTDANGSAKRHLLGPVRASSSDDALPAKRGMQDVSTERPSARFAGEGQSDARHLARPLVVQGSRF